MSTAITTPVNAAYIGAVGVPRCSTAPTYRRLRLTRRGQVVFTTLAAVPLLAGVGLGMLNGGQAAAGDTHATTTFQTVTVQPGESLWQVAEDQAPNADPRDFVQDVVTLNNLDGSAVQAGQQLSIPTHYTAGR